MKAQLLLEDGSTFEGELFGAPQSTAGEIVFNTGMVGYPEAMTDPSYRGQILTFTYPLIGNYGIPVHPVNGVNGNESSAPDNGVLSPFFESHNIHVKGIVVAHLSNTYSHWSALDSLDGWMRRHGVPGISGIDTRALTRRLRTHGCMLGKIVVEGENIPWDDPNKRNLVAEVSGCEPHWFSGRGDKRVIVVDLGCKHNIIRHLQALGLNILRVPWNYDWVHEEADGIVLSNGPGDPTMCAGAIEILQRGLERDLPILGICLGHQLLALAAGGETYKLKFGHRSQNQPCLEVGSPRCYITSQNHGYAVDEKSLPSEWRPWFFNANDGTNEGIRHVSKPILSVQFHPEANPGPTDTSFIFQMFLQLMSYAENRKESTYSR